MKNKIQWITIFGLMTFFFEMGMASALLTQSNSYFTPNRTISSKYWAAAEKLSLFTTVAGNAQLPGQPDGSHENVSILYYNSSGNLVATVYLANQTTSGTGLWIGSYSPTKTDLGSGALTFNVTDGGAEAITNITAFSVDASNAFKNPDEGLPSQLITQNQNPQQPVTTVIIQNKDWLQSFLDGWNIFWKGILGWI